MTTKNFNAKKMLMSTVAAVVFSFVFTTSAKAEVPVPTKSNVGIRVKGTQNSNLEIRVKDAPKSNLEIRVKDAPSQIEEFLEQILGIRVKVRV